jgi:hypothetical protein
LSVVVQLGIRAPYFHILLFPPYGAYIVMTARIVVAGTFVRPPRADQAGLTLEQRDETHTGRAHRQVRFGGMYNSVGEQCDNVMSAPRYIL